MDQFTAQSISVHHDSDNDIVLHCYSNLSEREGAEITIPLDEAADLLRALAGAVVGSTRSVMIDIKCGDCPTCQNVRLVREEQPNGHESSVRCPDCGDAYGEAVKDPYARPRIKGGIR